MTYILDANVFIQAKNLHYGFDFCPAFWDWLVQQSRAGKVASIDKVADELYSGDDELVDWSREQGDNFFLKADDAVLHALRTVSDCTKDGNKYTPAAVSAFLQVADFWLVAHALAHNYTVVTHEVPADTTHKIKIPDICISLCITCINPYDMLRREQARFVLGPDI